jgi:hypothetical protein
MRFGATVFGFGMIKEHLMTSKGKRSPREVAVSTLTKTTRSRPHSDDVWKSFLKLCRPDVPDSMAVMVLGSAVEQALEVAITTHFVLDAEGCFKMFEDNENPPIPTFACKIRLGYALGIYEKHIRDELNLIKGIRNAFAHARASISFSEAAISKVCNFLVIPDRWCRLGAGGKPVTLTSRERFYTSCEFLFLYLEDPDGGQKPKLWTKSRSYSGLEKTPTWPDNSTEQHL